MTEPQDKGTPRPWKLVPVEPTDEMLEAGASWVSAGAVYTAMCAAAPELPPAQDEMSATVRFWRSGTLSAQEAMIVVAGLLERSPPVFPLGVETGSAIEAPRAMSGLSHDAMKECVEELKEFVAIAERSEPGVNINFAVALRKVKAKAALANLERANG